jgi:undecaprenyl phosphate-alpha-L-ara4FN deformylase
LGEDCKWVYDPCPLPQPHINSLVMRLALKVDVDTLQGLREGVPALMEVLGERGVKASFFLALGPDHSGRAVFRVFRQRGFLTKMLRTRAPAMYSLKTMLYGTILPAPLIAAAAGEIVPGLFAAGHEVGLHGYDHVLWHDRLMNMNRDQVNREVTAAQGEFTRLAGRPARAFAAPGWQCSAVSRAVVAAQGFRYASDTRGMEPYYPRFGAEVTPVLEIPTTLPTLDELLGFTGCGAGDFTDLVLRRLRAGRPEVLTIHAEVEGGAFRGEFARLLDRGLEAGVAFFRLADWAEELLTHPGQIPAAPVYQGRLPGRAGTVSRQAHPEVGS